MWQFLCMSTSTYSKYLVKLFVLLMSSLVRYVMIKRMRLFVVFTLLIFQSWLTKCVLLLQSYIVFLIFLYNDKSDNAMKRYSFFHYVEIRYFVMWLLITKLNVMKLFSKIHIMCDFEHCFCANYWCVIVDRVARELRCMSYNSLRIVGDS